MEPSGPTLVLIESFGDRTNAVFGLLMRGGHTAGLEVLIASWLRRRVGRTVPARQKVRSQAEAIAQWRLGRL